LCKHSDFLRKGGRGRGRVQEGERHGGVRGGGGRHEKVQVHAAKTKCKIEATLSTQAAARRAGGHVRRVPEG